MAKECPTCEGSGFELKPGEGGVLTAVRCHCESRDRDDRLLRAANIPRRYEHCSFDSFEIHDPSHERSLRSMREWTEAFPVNEQGLLLHGPPGTGKTHLVVALGRELIRLKGVQVRFFEQRALLKALQGTFETGASQRESEVLSPVLDCEVLILDDLGAGRTTPWARDVMHDIIAHRYNERKPLVLTSNHALGGAADRTAKQKALDQPLSLKDRLGDALMSRLHEMCQIIELRGKDYRRNILAHRQ